MDYKHNPGALIRRNPTRALGAASAAMGAGAWAYGRYGRQWEQQSMRNVARNVRWLYNQTQGHAKAIVKKSADPSKSRRRRKAKSKKLRKLKGKNLRKEVLTIMNDVKDLKLTEKAGMANLTYRQFDSERINANQSGQGIQQLYQGRASDFETVIAQLKYFDSSTNTIVTASGAVGTDQKEFLFKSISSALQIRNNYQVDAEILVYICKPRGDTDTTPGQAWDAGISDDVGNVTSRTQYGVLPTDFDGFRDFYRAKLALKCVVAPGETVNTFNTIENVMYDPAFNDSHADEYQTKYKNFTWLVICRGTLGHDTVNTAEQGIIRSGIDIMNKVTYKVQYNAGLNFSYLHLVDNMPLFTTGDGVQSHQPIPDNVAYALA